MTKVFVLIGLALGALLIAGVILSLVAPKRISVTNKKFIRASKQEVFDQLRFMKNFPNWSPFLRQDPEQRYTVSGPDGEVGATYSWQGVGEKSEGSQRVARLSAPNEVVIACAITVPFRSNPTFRYELVSQDGGVEVVQHFDTEMPVPANIFGLLLGLENKISITNQHGLELLKQVSEKTAALTSK